MPTSQELIDLAKDEFSSDNDLKESTIKSKFRQLEKIVIENFDRRVWFLTEACLSVVVSCILKDTTNPVGLILVDGPSTEKTTVLDFFDGLKMTYRVDKFTPASFLTQSGSVKKDKLSQVDLLPKIAYKTMVIPEMGPTFNQPKEVLMENYALLARILDGTGLTTAGGIHGVRKLEGDYMFGMLGATTPLSQTAWNTMGKIGSRLIFLHVPSKLSRSARRERALGIFRPQVHYKKRKKTVKKAIQDFIDFFFKQQSNSGYLIPDNAPENVDSIEKLEEHCGYLPRCIEWDGSLDDDDAIEIMVILAEFLTACRSDVTAWTERGEDGSMETNSSGVVLEGVERFSSVIYNMARCHALLCGRNRISLEDIPLIVEIAISSLPDDRRKAIELLIDTDKKSDLGEFTITELSKAMSCSDKTAKTIMRKLEILGIGKQTDGLGNSPKKFIIADDYGWLATDDFQSYYRTWEHKKEEDSGENSEIPF